MVGGLPALLVQRLATRFSPAELRMKLLAVLLRLGVAAAEMVVWETVAEVMVCRGQGSVCRVSAWRGDAEAAAAVSAVLGPFGARFGRVPCLCGTPPAFSARQGVATS